MKIVLTPDWFLGKDVLIESFSFLVLFIFFALCYKYYKLSQKKNFLYLGIGFLLIAIGQLATILTKLVLYYDVIFTKEVEELILTYNVTKSVDIFYYIGFFMNRFLTLIGLFVIYKLPLKEKNFSDFFLAIYFMILLSWISSSTYYFFHITVIVLLVLIISNYYEIYIKNKNKNTKLFILALLILLLSHCIFIVSKMEICFVIANIIELISYIILTMLMMRILKYQKSIS